MFIHFEATQLLNDSEWLMREQEKNMYVSLKEIQEEQYTATIKQTELFLLVLKLQY